jgi:pimeloyl-ACP methyl ester carboxylesterase
MTMRQARFTRGGACVRWTEAAGDGPATVYVHGLGAASAPYHAHIAAAPALAGRRSLFVDLPGFGISDRPADFGYTLDEHAAALGTALERARVAGADLVAHSMGGAIAILLAARRPDLVGRLVLVEANLDPYPPGFTGSSGILAYSEEEFTRGPGFAETLRRVGPTWRSTMRCSDPLALYRSAASLARGTTPTTRELLLGLPIPRTYLQGARSGPLAGHDELTAAGVDVVTVPGAGHCVMFDQPQALVRAIAAGGQCAPGSWPGVRTATAR